MNCLFAWATLCINKSANQFAKCYKVPNLKCMETKFMRKKNKLQNKIKYRMKTTFQRQSKRKKMIIL